jgi:hypothetical protein
MSGGILLLLTRPCPFHKKQKMQILKDKDYREKFIDRQCGDEKSWSDLGGSLCRLLTLDRQHTSRTYRCGFEAGSDRLKPFSGRCWK